MNNCMKDILIGEYYKKLNEIISKDCNLDDNYLNLQRLKRSDLIPMYPVISGYWNYLLSPVGKFSLFKFFNLKQDDKTFEIYNEPIFIKVLDEYGFPEQKYIGSEMIKNYSTKENEKIRELNNFKLKIFDNEIKSYKIFNNLIKNFETSNFLFMYSNSKKCKKGDEGLIITEFLSAKKRLFDYLENLILDIVKEKDNSKRLLDLGSRFQSIIYLVFYNLAILSEKGIYNNNYDIYIDTIREDNVLPVQVYKYKTNAIVYIKKLDYNKQIKFVNFENSEFVDKNNPFEWSKKSTRNIVEFSCKVLNMLNKYRNNNTKILYDNIYYSIFRQGENSNFLEKCEIPNLYIKGLLKSEENYFNPKDYWCYINTFGLDVIMNNYTNRLNFMKEIRKENVEIFEKNAKKNLIIASCNIFEYPFNNFNFSKYYIKDLKIGKKKGDENVRGIGRMSNYRGVGRM